jgi:hypothetical protein
MKKRDLDSFREIRHQRFGDHDSTLILEQKIEESGKQLYTLVYHLLEENTELKNKLAHMEIGFREFKKGVTEMNREMARRLFLEDSHGNAIRMDQSR